VEFAVVVRGRGQEGKDGVQRLVLQYRGAATRGDETWGVRGRLYQRGTLSADPFFYST
jgi:hypothetical protein